MSSHKYANLPDIDTAPDIYETEDAFPSAGAENAESSDEDAAVPARSATRSKGVESAPKEELDSSNLMGTDEATQRFRKAERRRAQSRTQYGYPPSPTYLPSIFGPSPSAKPVPLAYRLRSLQAELTALEAELADPTNPQLHQEREEDNVDPGELIRGLVDVRGRLEKIRKGKEGRAKLVKVVLGGDSNQDVPEWQESTTAEDSKGTVEGSTESKADVRSISEMDRRVGELENLIGTSNVALDESSPMPTPLLPLITRLTTQLTLLTQPRHIDSISRRLKLLLSDLDRASASQQHGHRRNPSQPNAAATSQTQDQVLPLLDRLGPSLPQIPHILTRLRTLSTLHTAAAEFHGTLESLEDEQKTARKALDELEVAVGTVEESMEANQTVVKGNVSSLESRVEELLVRLEELGRGQDV
ncbi:hypothetical protein HGRIS_002263 [Hohenbuehelia grisea]|uniref:Dynamitin n=1 Tax=Hohenbuehelia grisea TaxID=104357 RepID=A0ABR3JKF6_9AGAR